MIPKTLELVVIIVFTHDIQVLEIILLTANEARRTRPGSFSKVLVSTQAAVLHLVMLPPDVLQAFVSVHAGNAQDSVGEGLVRQHQASPRITHACEQGKDRLMVGHVELRIPDSCLRRL